MIDGVEREADILIHAIALWTVLVLTAYHGALQHIGLLLHPGLCRYRAGLAVKVAHLVALVLGERHRLHNGDAALIAAGVATVGVQRPGGVRFIDTAVRIVREHGVALVGADAVSSRNEDRLVVVAGERCRHIVLNESAFPATLAAGAYLQRLGCVQHQRCVHAACSHAGGQRLYLPVLGYLAASIGGMVLDCHAGNDPGSKRGRAFLLISDAAALGAVFGAETAGLHDAWRVVSFGTESGRFVSRNINPLSALVIQNIRAVEHKIAAGVRTLVAVPLRTVCGEESRRYAVIDCDAVAPRGHSTVDAEGRGFIRNGAVVSVYAEACRSSAVFSISGSSLPRVAARRIIP